MYKIFSAILILTASDYFESWFSKVINCNNGIYINEPFQFSADNIKYVLTSERLSYYDGVKRRKRFTSFLGTVFDVTKSKEYSDENTDLNYLLGKDASRSVITLDFQDESENKDHVLDFDCRNIFLAASTMEIMRKQYNTVGVLEGRYYNIKGKTTDYFKQFIDKHKRCVMDLNTALLEDRTMPPCILEWYHDNTSKVWCATNSGWQKRSWVGVPRQLQTPGQNYHRCVCVQPDFMPEVGSLEVYEGCPDSSSECTFDYSIPESHDYDYFESTFDDVITSVLTLQK